MYDLSARNLSEGDVLGKRSRPLSLAECYDVAMTFQHFIVINQDNEDDNGDWVRIADDWLELASLKYTFSGLNQVADELQLALLQMMRHVYQRVNCQCSHEDVLNDERWIQRNPHLTLIPRKKECISLNVYNCDKALSKVLERRQLFNGICRGDDISISDQVHVQKSQNSACRYNNHNDPRLILSPAKEEDVITGLIVKVHDVVSKKEIETLKQLGSPLMKRTTVLDMNGVRRKSDVRVGEFGILPDEYHSIAAIRNLRQRLEAVSGLNINLGIAENLRVSNYAISGYFGLHHDAHTKTERNLKLMTIITYLNDVVSSYSLV